MLRRGELHPARRPAGELASAEQQEEEELDEARPQPRRRRPCATGGRERREPRVDDPRAIVSPARRLSPAPRTHSQVAARPSSSPTIGVNPSSLAAREGSRKLRRTSPSRAGACSAGVSDPATLAQSPYRSTTDVSPPGPDVEDAAIVADRRDGHSRDVAHVHVIARLEAVAEDLRLLPARERAEEDGDDAGLAVGILPRARRRSRSAARRVSCRRGGCTCAGTPPRRASRCRRARAARGVSLRVQARRTRRRSHRRSTRRPTWAPWRRASSRMCTVPSTFTCASSTGGLHGDPHVGLRGEVEDGVRAHRVEDVVEGVPDVPHVQLGLGRHVLLACRGRACRRSQPRFRRVTSASTTCEPMNPAPPVTIARTV